MFFWGGFFEGKRRANKEVFSFEEGKVRESESS